MTAKINDTFQVFFATNRNLQGTADQPEFGKRFHRDGPRFYRVGVATVQKVSEDLDAGYRIDELLVFDEGKEDPQQKGSNELFTKMRKAVVEGNRDALIYIHGFANSFSESISRAAQLHELYLVGTDEDGNAKHPLVLVLCWPSNGKVSPPWQYFSDRNDAEDSGHAMARAVKRFYDFMCQSGGPCYQRIHLVAHSMGAWVLRHTVQSLKSIAANQTLEPLFDNVFLMAADEDNDTFEHEQKLKPLSELARHIHVYHSHDDLALVVSDTTKFNPDRLGHSGLRTFSGISSQVVAIDCEQVDDTGFLHVNHQYYRRRIEVISDVRQVLSGKRPHDVTGRDVVEPGRRYRIKATDAPPLLDTPDAPVGPRYAGPP